MDRVIIPIAIFFILKSPTLLAWTTKISKRNIKNVERRIEERQIAMQLAENRRQQMNQRRVMLVIQNVNQEPNELEDNLAEAKKRFDESLKRFEQLTKPKDEGHSQSGEHLQNEQSEQCHQRLEIKVTVIFVFIIFFASGTAMSHTVLVTVD